MRFEVCPGPSLWPSDSARAIADCWRCLSRRGIDDVLNHKVMKALFETIENLRGEKEHIIALEKKVLALNPNPNPAGKKTTHYVPSAGVNVFYATPTSTPFDTFFCSPNPNDPRHPPTRAPAASMFTH